MFVMPALRLHTKTTLRGDGWVIAALLSLVSIRVAGFVREEQRQLAKLQASNFAEHIADSLAGAEGRDRRVTNVGKIGGLQRPHGRR